MKQTPHRHTPTLRQLRHALLAGASILLCACGEDIVGGLFQDDTPIELSTSFEQMNVPFTRAIDYDAINKDGFTVNRDGHLDQVLVNLTDGTHNYGGDQTYTIQGTAGQVSKKIGQDKTLYFYQGYTSVDVWARYPHGTDNITTSGGHTYLTVAYDQSDADNYQKSDLMISRKVACTREQQKDGTYSVNEAQLSFSHQMAKIVITATVVTPPQTSKISNIKIKDIKLKQVKPTLDITPSFDSEGAPVVGSVSGTPTDILLYQDETGVTSCAGAALFPPQTFTHSESTGKLDFVIVDITYEEDGDTKTEECEYYFKDGGKTFQGGNTYVMNLYIGEKDVRLQDEYNVTGVALTQWQNDELRTDISAAAEFVLLTTGEKGMTVTVSQKERVYTGNEITLTATGDNPELVVQSNDASVGTLMYGRDYRLLYVDNIDAGTASVIVEGAGIYIGTLDAKFPISQKDIASQTISVDFTTTETYNTREHKPTPTVTDSEPTDTRRQRLLAYDYEIAYASTVNAGKGTATLTGKGNYKGTRTETFTIGQAEGKVTYSEPNLSLVMPEGHTFYYITSYTVVGDGQPQSIVSKNTDAIDNISLVEGSFNSSTKTGKIKFRVKKAVSGAKIVMTLKGTNYDYSKQDPNTTNTITITQGPKLPIEYVAQYDIGSFTSNGENSTCSFASDYESQHVAWLTWYTSNGGGAPIRALNKNEMTVSGVKYHIPSTWEWRSIFPANSNIYWGISYQKVMDTGVGFGVTVTNRGSRTTNSNDDGYSYGMSKEETATWQSDFYNDASNAYNYTVNGNTYYSGLSTGTYVNCTNVSNSFATNKTNSPDMTCYALRFKGTTYCSAWRYDWVWSDSETANATYNKKLTKNSYNRKSMVVRVIYLGPTFEYTNESNWQEELKNLSWTNADGVKIGWDDYNVNNGSDDSKVIIRRFPCVGARYYNDIACEAAGTARNTDRYEMNWFWSCSPFLGTANDANPQYQSVRLTYPFAQGDQNHSNCSFPVRMFKDK